MTQEERLIHLTSLVEQRGKVTLNDICEQFDVSRDSARRDLVKLTQRPGIQRIRGGAVKAAVSTRSEPYVGKAISAAKQQLALCAASLVEANDTLLLDTGTTHTLLAGQLSQPSTVVTNSVDILQQLAGNPDMKVHLLGGHFDAFHRAILGAQAEKQLTEYRVNKAFIGVCALSEHGLSTNNEQEASLKKAMMAQAQQVILVCEHHKIGQDNFHHICSLDAVDVLITDQPLTTTDAELFDHHDIQVIVINVTKGQC
ncbi:DeoR/GlpR family DNA-binding transcription regulator [Photobacterium galatheae]|uniref:DeoR faimly transcriptional regulator n=1 Tax=Photobacterium galatheae TaxID=1654360 RepID=A0A066RUQ4_9GAMM|nr:DeoR/GlpR family DNA-binding transcription regulator [Photobacterium galatheae]KDM91108.1 DeoR faimly transcriptional regulator [Photobacterium galatheae]MCM0150170.1 DeoR/GlpR transcriptional regulator [Photobacterium galatheae]